MNKTQYLAARAQWKADYYALQQRIRDSKQALRDAHRALSKFGEARWEGSLRAWTKAHNSVLDALYAKRALSDEMTKHLTALGNLKEEARRAWEAREAAMA